MARPSADQIVAWYNKLAGVYGQRNTEYTVLRKAFDAEFLADSERKAIGLGEFDDRLHLKYNMVNTAVRRFMDEMSGPISLRCTPRSFRPEEVRLSEKRQKALMRWADMENLDLKKIQAAFNQSLLDKATLHTRPDPSHPMKCRLDLVQPESYFPMPKSSSWTDKDAVLIGWKKHDLKNDSNQDPIIDPMGRSQEDVQSSQGRIIEYWDREWYVRVEDGKIVDDEQHGLGEIVFDDAHNIPIPHRHRGQGDADQSVGLNEYLNSMMSDQADVLGYLANPIVVVRGSNVGSNQLVFGPRAIWHLERDGSAEILTWAGSPPSFEAQILRTMQGIEDSTGISSPAFGREIPSGVSGETVRSILAGFNTRVGTKQTCMGIALNGCFRKAQAIWEKIYPNVELFIPGEGDDPEKPGDVLKGKDIGGFYDLKVIFQPQNEGVRVFTELQKMEKGVQSKLQTMKNLGIANPEEEMGRINDERAKEMEQQLQQNALQGGGVLGQQPGGAFGLGSPPPGAGVDPRQPQQPGLVSGAEGRAGIAGNEPGSLAADPEQLEEFQGGATGKIRVADVFDRLADLDISGRASISGQIVEEGETSGRVTLFVDKASDIPQVREALGSIAGKFDIKTSNEKPQGLNTLTVARPQTRR